MGNIIDAIIEMVRVPDYKLRGHSEYHNRANQMGSALEDYIKDLFAGTVGETDPVLRNRKLNETFCYLGNQNNPPDSMLRHGGDAIEVKKIESSNSVLALNSSYPKSKLYANNAMLSRACRACEHWIERDMIYAVGVVGENDLKSLAFVYGYDYCAEENTYLRIRETIKRGVESIPDVEFAETKELGRVNRVDPLGITSLRVRGMWQIENPFIAFDYLYRPNLANQFNFMAIINRRKWESFGNTSLLEELARKINSLQITNAQIKDPNNPADLRDVKLITYYI